MMILTIDGEIELPVAADAEIDVLQALPGIVALFEQNGAGHILSVARAKYHAEVRFAPSNVFEMDRVGRMPTWA